MLEKEASERRMNTETKLTRTNAKETLIVAIVLDVIYISNDKEKYEVMYDVRPSSAFHQAGVDGFVHWAPYIEGPGDAAESRKESFAMSLRNLPSQRLCG
jgi:hypothetical protein